MKAISLRLTTLFILAFAMFPSGMGLAQGKRLFFREDFKTLDNWRPLYFPKIKKHSSYTIEKQGLESLLKAESDSSASGLILKREFNVCEFPNVCWRWQVENVYARADIKTKAGDDCPLRICVLFKYDPENAGIFERLQYTAARLIYGEYPPHSSLNYVWASEECRERVLASPYTEKSKMILLQKGTAKIKTWQREEINIVHDYHEAFGGKAPETASIAIMNDSDNTGEKSVCYVDYLEICNNTEIQ